MPDRSGERLKDRATACYDRILVGLESAEDRPGQRQMLRAVASAFESGRHLLVEAGTGTGKSLAYLIPAIESGEQTIVATSTKALQAQLTEKDLPIAASGFDRRVEWQLVKGRSNYVCLAKLDSLGEILEPEVEAVVTWARSSETGDLADFDGALSQTARAAVTVVAEECPGAGNCSFGETCFSELARNRASVADVVVVNHHLLLADLQMRAVGSPFLPEVGQVVVDEAHRFEDAAITVFGAEIHAGRARYITRLARSLLVETDIAETIETAAERAFGIEPIRRPAALEGPLRQRVVDALAPLDEALLRLARELQGVGDDLRERRVRVEKLVSSLSSDISRIFSPSPDDVVWVERAGTDPRICVAPIEVGDALGALLTEATAVFTSATLVSTGGFDRVASLLGVSGHPHDAVEVPSPFDYRSQALLYCATGLPDPREEAFGPASHRVMKELIGASGGSAFLLFTSRRAMNAAFDAIGGEIEYPAFRQGDHSPGRLVEKFVTSSPAVLFATLTFWQGVDIAGDALRLVVIDKIPFSPPDDPLVRARSARVESRGGNPFAEESLPRAGLLLKQGVGRLIRSVRDRGVVAVLDNRLERYRYGDDLLASLPPMSRATSLPEVVKFLKSTS